jgi:hypothetical protein
VREHLCAAPYARIEGCEIDYHVRNILSWLTRCFLCRIYDDEIGSDYVFTNFLENNYWPELVHEEWVNAIYWDIHAMLSQCLPGWANREQYPGRLAIHTANVDITQYGHLQILGDPETLTLLLQRERIH